MADGSECGSGVSGARTEKGLDVLRRILVCLRPFQDKIGTIYSGHRLCEHQVSSI